MSIAYEETIKDPLIELLAIKLFEHDSEGSYVGFPFPGTGRPPETLRTGWVSLPCEDRELYRQMARGEQPIGRNR